MEKIIMIGLAVMLISVPAHAAYVTAESGLCVREKPDEESERVRVLPIGTEVDGEITDGWMQIGDGYISTDYIGDEDPLELIGTWRVTAYAYTGSACANGEMPEMGRTIAHNSLPFGTRIYIEGVGVREVMDRGPAYLGTEWCDLYLGDVAECVNWGDQTREIWLVK